MQIVDLLNSRDSGHGHTYFLVLIPLGAASSKTSTDSFKTDQALATMRMEIRISTRWDRSAPSPSKG